MKKVTIDSSTLYLADCMEVLSALSGISAVITDPPYGVGYAEWDDRIPDLSWLEWSRVNAPVTMFTPGNGSQYEYPRPDWTLCWARPGSVQRAAGGGFSHWEPILVYGRNPMMVDCRVFNPSTGGEFKDRHPCPKPLAVMEWLVDAINGVVLDPFMGSGTTGVACARLGRPFIGIERDAAYFELACERITSAHRQLSLFDELDGHLPGIRQADLLSR